ncbi:MAG: DUF4255 domain-containing protein [Acidimicrobiales bacterium]
MLHHLDESLELFLRDRVPLGVREIDVAFDAPDQTWAGTISRPTVNVFLYDLQRSVTRAVAGQEVIEQHGATVRRMAPTFVDCRYLVSTWTSEPRDSHQLLGALLRAVISHREIPPAYLSGPLAEAPQAPRLALASVAQRDQQHAQLWPALEGQLHPALDLVVTVAIEPSLSQPAGPPIEGLELISAAMSPSDGGGSGSGGGFPGARRRMVAGRTHPDASGAVVSSPRGTSVVNGAGSFLVAAQTGDQLILHTEPQRTVTVPAMGGVEL